jgi:hypothetical protein
MKRLIGFAVLAAIGYYLWKNHFRRLFEPKDQVKEVLEEVRLKNEIGDNKRAVFLANQVPTATIGDTPYAGTPLTAFTAEVLRQPKDLQLLPKGGTTSKNPFDRVLNWLNVIALLVTLAGAGAATAAVPIVTAYSKTTYVNATEGNALKNGLMLTNIATKQRAGTLVYVAPGNYWIGTNTQSLLPRGVDLYISPGATITMGTTADTLSDNALFDDILAGTGATTNRIYGRGEIYCSNTLGRVLWSTASASRWYIEAKVARVLGQNPALSIDAGGARAIVTDILQADNYDAVTTGNPAPAFVYVDAGAVYAGDSIVECGAAFANWGDAVFNIGYAEALSTGGAYGNGVLCIADNSIFNISVLNLKRSSASIYGTLTNQNATGNGVLQNCQIRALPGSTFSVVQRPSSTFGTAFKLRNCTIIGPTARDVIEANPMAGKLTVQDCTFICGSSATNWARPSAAGNCNIVLQGDLNVNLTNHAGITVIGKSYTTNTTAEIGL